MLNQGASKGVSLLSQIDAKGCTEVVGIDSGPGVGVHGSGRSSLMVELYCDGSRVYDGIGVRSDG